MLSAVSFLGKMFVLALFCIFFVALSYQRGSFVFKMPNHLNGVTVVDFAKHNLPPVRLGERVIDLMSGNKQLKTFKKKNK